MQRLQWEQFMSDPIDRDKLLKEIGAIRGALCNLADLCEQAIYSNDTKKLKDACKQIVSTAELLAGYKRRMTK